jgi:hypothetical protein
MGCELTGNQESIFFQTLNKDALDIIGCNWRCVDFLPEVEKMYSHYAWLLGFVRRRLDAGVLPGHFGVRDANSQDPIDSTWGWKDPRNSLLLPIWHQIFPNAKVIHMLRDGRNAALSLLARDIKREKFKDFFRPIQQDRFKSYFELWKIYIQRIQQAMSRVSQCCTVRYEDLLDSPRQEIHRIADFLGQPIRRPIEALCTIVDRRKTEKKLEPEFRWVERVQLDLQLLNELGYL